MNTSTAARIGGVVAAIALTATMTACSGGQSVADACKIANAEMTTATSSMSSDLNSAMQNATSGEKVDFAALFAPVTEGLDAASAKITNDTVKKPLDAFSTEYKSFVKAFEGFEIPDMKTIDPADPSAIDKLTQAQEKLKEISTKAQDASTKLTDQAKKLQDVCNKA